MKEGDRQLGKPARLYQDTKANIVALGLGAGDEGCVAYATDTDDPGTFDGAVWTWTARPPAVAGYALVSDGVDTWAADQTPAWTGEHSFAAGIAFVGASGANEITVPDNAAIALELLDAGGLEYVRVNSENANPYFLIDPAAAGINVGIGTPTPAASEHIYSTADAHRGIIIDAKGTSSGQSCFLNLLTVGTGAVSVGDAASQGWHFTARGNAYVTALQQNDLLIYFWDGSGWALMQYWDHLGNVGLGVLYPSAKCHIDQASTTAAIPVLTLDQADVSDGFINFIGSDRGVILSDSDSLRSVRVEWNGTVYRLALHVDA